MPYKNNTIKGNINMKFKIKKYLIQEGITDFVKNNWGKGLVAASGLVMANAGVFGDKAQKAVEMGGEKLNSFVKDAGDWSKQSFEKMEQKYGTNPGTNPSNPSSNTQDHNQQPNPSNTQDHNQPGIFDKFDHNKNQASANQSPNSLVDDHLTQG